MIRRRRRPVLLAPAIAIVSHPSSTSGVVNTPRQNRAPKCAYRTWRTPRRAKQPELMRPVADGSRGRAYGWHDLDVTRPALTRVVLAGPHAAAVFDMDDVLLDSEGERFLSYQGVARSLGGDFSEADTLQTMGALHRRVGPLRRRILQGRRSTDGD